MVGLAQLMSSATGGPHLLLHSLQGMQSLASLLQNARNASVLKEHSLSYNEVCSLLVCILCPCTCSCIGAFTSLRMMALHADAVLKACLTCQTAPCSSSAIAQ